MNECTVFDECRVQRAKRISLNIEIPAKMRFQSREIFGDCFFQTDDADARGQGSKYGQIAAKLSVYEYQLGGSILHVPRLQVGIRNPSFTLFGKRKRSARNRGDVRKAPVFIARSWKSGLAEAREGVFPQFSQPRQIAS